MSWKTISASELKTLLESGQNVQLIDVRTPAEYEEIHVRGARLIPLNVFDAQKVVDELGNNGPIYVLCRSGNRAKTACERLLASGATNIILVEGGTLACEQAGLPMIRGKRMRFTIEQQARIIIGGGVLLFSLLGYFLHPAFVFGAALFGLGQIYVGLTNNCFLALMLAYMPWNRGATSNTSTNPAPASATATAAQSPCSTC